MTASAQVAAAIQTGLSTGKVGEPVMARLAWHHCRDRESLLPALADGIARAATWFHDAWESIQVFGSETAGHVTALTRFSRGASALVSAAVPHDGQALLEALLYGSRGVLSWEADRAWTAVESFAAAATSPLLPAVRESLHQRTTATPDGARHGDVAAAEGLATATAPVHRPVAPPYGVLLVAGDNTHQPGYAQALASDPRCRLVGVTDQPRVAAERRELNARLAARLQVPLLPDLDAALRRDDVQIVVVCAEPERRGPILVAAAGLGKHLYLDKPLAGSVGDARAIAAAVAASGVAAQMFSQIFWEPGQRLQSLVQSGAVGHLWAMHCDVTFAKGDLGRAGPLARRREAAAPDRFELPDGKRELTNIGVYPVVMQLWLGGRLPRRVAAATCNGFLAEHQTRDMEDGGQVLIEFDDGSLGSLTAARTGWQSHPAQGVNRTILVGDRGQFVVDGHRPRLEMWSDAPAWLPPGRNPDDPLGMWQTPPGSPYQAAPKTTWTVPYSTSWTADTREFLDCLEQGRLPQINVSLAATATQLLAAAYQSAAAGRAVAIDSARDAR